MEEKKDDLDNSKLNADNLPIRKDIASLLSESVQHGGDGLPKGEITKEEKAKREMIAGRIGHELNNPLAVITSEISNLELYLSQDRQLDGDEIDMINAIKMGADCLREVIIRMRSDVLKGKMPFEQDK